MKNKNPEKIKNENENEKGIAILAVVFIAMFFSIAGMIAGAKHPTLLDGKKITEPEK